MSLMVASRLDCLGPGALGWGGRAVSLRRGRGRVRDFVRDRALRVLVLARILVIVSRKAFADLHQREHAAHLDRPVEWAIRRCACVHRNLHLVASWRKKIMLRAR